MKKKKKITQRRKGQRPGRKRSNMKILFPLLLLLFISCRTTQDGLPYNEELRADTIQKIYLISNHGDCTKGLPDEIFKRKVYEIADEMNYIDIKFIYGYDMTQKICIKYAVILLRRE